MSKPRLVKCNKSGPSCGNCDHAKPHEAKVTHRIRCTIWDECNWLLCSTHDDPMKVRCCAVAEKEES